MHFIQSDSRRFIDSLKLIFCSPLLLFGAITKLREQDSGRLQHDMGNFKEQVAGERPHQSKIKTS